MCPEPARSEPRSAGRLVPPLFFAVVAALAVAWWRTDAATGRPTLVAPARRATPGRTDESVGAIGPERPIAAVREPAAASSLPRRAPLVPLDPAAMRTLERRGRAIFQGVVYRFDRAPCADAQLFFDGELVARSDANGVYEFEVEHDVLARGGDAATIAAVKPGAGTAVRVVEGPSRRLDLVLERGARVTGRVLQAVDRVAVADALVDALLRPFVRGGCEFPLALVTRTDARGEFAFDHLPAGTIELRARGATGDTLGFAERTVPGTEHGATGERCALDVCLEATTMATVTGWFAPWPPPEAERAKGPGFEARAWTRASARRWFDGRTFTVAVGGDGAFTLALPVGAAFDFALANGAAAWWADTLALPRGVEHFALGRIALGGASAISGCIELPPDAADFRPSAWGTAIVGDVACEFAAPLDRDGRFVIGPFPLEAATLSIGLLGRELVARRRIEVRSGRDVDLEIVRPSGHCWFGVVRDPEGAPVANARILLGGLDREEAWNALDETRSDGEGRFVVGGPLPWQDGAPELEVMARGQLPCRVVLPAADAAGFTRFDLTLARGEPLRGVVRDRAGAPAVAAWVELLAHGIEPDAARDVTGLDGRFELAGGCANSGTWMVELQDGTSWSTPFSRDPGARGDFVLTPPEPPTRAAR